MNDLILLFEAQFEQLHLQTMDLLFRSPETDLFTASYEDGQLNSNLAVGTLIIRSAAEVEMVFGGITTRLWDDPFEWTLPEELSTKQAISNYLGEVEITRNNGFSAFSDDSDLFRLIPAPSELTSIAQILIGALCRSEHILGRASYAVDILSQSKA